MYTQRVELISGMFDFLGRGGHGRVYRSGKGKVTKIGDLGPEEVTCQSEAANLGISPGVLDSTDNSITMEEIPGETIWHKGEISAEQYAILEQKVGKAHANRLFHNDLVAQNIMIDDNGEPQIIDWGRGSTIWPDPECRDDNQALKNIKRRYVK